LQRWAENSPQNFQSQHLLVSAEMARLRGQSVDAMALYEAAITAATTHERRSAHALVNELCARFWLEWGPQKIAAVFMAEAQSGYAQWGAVAKVKHLERTSPELLGTQASAGLRWQAEAVTTTLAVATVMKRVWWWAMCAATSALPVTRMWPQPGRAQFSVYPLSSMVSVAACFTWRVILLPRPLPLAVSKCCVCLQRGPLFLWKTPGWTRI
jgi:hypothetical protein